MKAFISTYERTELGLVLKGDSIRELAEYGVKEFLGDYNLSYDELVYQVGSVKNSIEKRGYSSIIEINGPLIQHIRFVK